MDRSKRLVTRISCSDYEKLEQIRDTYGFRSVYQIQQVLVNLFLAWKFREEDIRDVTVPAEIEEMFEEFRDWECEYRTRQPQTKGKKKR